ncbi:hypothetical protein V8F44DRAFT_616280 [Aspergillus fumigatus]
MAHIRKVSIVHRPIRIRLDSDLELFDNPFGTQVINHFAVDVGTPGNLKRYELERVDGTQDVELNYDPNAGLANNQNVRGFFIETDVVGYTSYSDKKILQIAHNLISQHGSYHFFKNNCQLWANKMFNEIADLQFHLDPCIGELFGLFSRFSLDDEDGPLPSMQAQYVHLLPPPNSCKRVSNLSEPVRCDECGEDIPRWSDYFYHCCQCPLSSDADNYDICQTCFETFGRGCQLSEDHSLYKIGQANEPSDCARLSIGSKSNLFSNMWCDYCHDPIAEANYYHCCACDNDNFDLCIPCYKSGARCHDPSHAAMMLLSEPRRTGPNITRLAPMFCLRKECKRLFCDHCQECFDPSLMTYLHCCVCHDDNFDICLECASKGLLCEEEGHLLYLM